MQVEVEIPVRGDEIPSAVLLDDGVLSDPISAAASPVRRAYAAAHVVWHARDDGGEDVIDWEATAALRRRLDARGFAVAEAMDTAQRFEIGWPVAERLVRMCGSLDLEHGFVAGAGADGSEPAVAAEVVDRVVAQGRTIQECGGEVILLPIPWLSRRGSDADTYVDVYRAIIERLDGPLWIHWLGEMFSAEVTGYFPGDSFDRVMVLDVDKVRGAKLSLLDPEREVVLRRRLATRGQLLLTGDDLNFERLLRGGDATESGEIASITGDVSVGGRPVSTGDFSHALLGVLDAVAAPMASALDALAHGDGARYHALAAPAEALGRVLFEAPTRHYRAGLAFLGWLSGHQDDFHLFGDAERNRTLAHYLRVAQLASDAGVIENAVESARRLSSLFADPHYAWLGASPRLK